MTDDAHKPSSPHVPGSAPPAPRAPVENACPRCGGAPAPARKLSRFNPFLPNPKMLTCSDCGLSYPMKPAQPSR